MPQFLKATALLLVFAASNAAAAGTLPDTQPVQLAAAAPAYDEALAEQGEKVFRRCKSCHQIGENAKNRVGPALNGVFGAKVGHVTSFKYSKAFRKKMEEGAVWDAETLDVYLTKPRAWAKGTRMTFPGLKKADDRKAVIELLKKHSQ